VSVVALLSLFVNALTLGAGGRRPAVVRREFLVLLAWAGPGLPLGALVLSRLSADAVRVMVAVMVLVALAQRRFSGRYAGATLPAPVAGLLSGALTTATGLNGPPLVLRLTGLPITARERRHTLAALFLALGALAIVTLAIGGQLHAPTWLPALAATAALGAYLGAHTASRIASHVDDRLVTALLVAAAVTAATTGLT
jgi:hypothetical protein